MNETELRQKIQKCIEKVIGKEVSNETGLISGGYMDSFGMLALVSELEDEFRIGLPVEEIAPEHFETLEYIEETIGKYL